MSTKLLHWKFKVLGKVLSAEGCRVPTIKTSSAAMGDIQILIKLRKQHRLRDKSNIKFALASSFFFLCKCCPEFSFWFLLALSFLHSDAVCCHSKTTPLFLPGFLNHPRIGAVQEAYTAQSQGNCFAPTTPSYFHLYSSRTSLLCN